MCALQYAKIIVIITVTTITILIAMRIQNHIHYCVSAFTSSKNLNYANTETEILPFCGKGYETVGNKILVMKKYNPIS